MVAKFINGLHLKEMTHLQRNSRSSIQSLKNIKLIPATVIVPPLEKMGWTQEQSKKASNLQTEFKAVFPHSPRTRTCPQLTKTLQPSQSLLSLLQWQHLASSGGRGKGLSYIYLLWKVLSLVFPSCLICGFFTRRGRLMLDMCSDFILTPICKFKSLKK